MLQNPKHFECQHDALRKCSLEYFGLIWGFGMVNQYSANISKSEKKKLKCGTLLVPSISDRGYSTCAFKFVVKILLAELCPGT